ncbi:MAG: hypothetical protein DRJ56_04885, partial [Thermoprotei archaeon]
MVVIQAYLDLSINLELLILLANSALVVAALALLVRLSLSLSARPGERLVEQVRLLERSVVSSVSVLKNTLERLVSANMNLLSAMEIKVKEMDFMARRVSEKADSGLIQVESALVSAPASAQVVERLEDLDCVFRDDGLLVCGSYDEKLVAYLTQALRVLESVGFEGLEISRGGSVLS